jgi:hypothetical protein
MREAQNVTGTLTNFYTCAAEAAFLGYTAENSHHLTAKIISKEALFNRGKYQPDVK